MATDKQVTPAQVALAWLLHRKPWIVPIAGATKLHRLEENIGGADVASTDGDLQCIDHALAGIQVQGDRYAADRQKLIDR